MDSGVLEPDAELRPKPLWTKHQLNASDVNETGGAAGSTRACFSQRGERLHANTTLNADQTV